VTRTADRYRPLYDDPELAAAYARVSASNVANAAYERPAIRELLWDAGERDVLDAGCAAGEHAAWLVERGARVVALDVSETMVRLARERLGERAPVLRVDLEETLPFGEATFDIVVSSLTMHYLRDWTMPLREFVRVLRPGGKLVLSTHHPYLTVEAVAEYHAIAQVEEAWSGFAAEPVPVRFFHRPLERIVGAGLAAGFVLCGLHEPLPTRDADTRDAAFAAQLRARPGFLIVEAETRPR